jgi:DNA-binding PadR family transcriptional regulator
MRTLDLRILSLVADGTPFTRAVHEKLVLEGTKDLSWWDRFWFSAGHVYGRMRELEWAGYLDSVDDGIPRPERGGRSRRSYTIADRGMEALRESLFYKRRKGRTHSESPETGSGDS